MIKAITDVEATPNFGPFDWTTICGSNERIGSVHDCERSKGYYPNWNKGFYTKVFHLPDRVVVHAIDRIDNVPGHLPDWAIETSDSGVVKTRPCGVAVHYSLSEDHVREFGLPHEEQIKAAFHEDALKALTYAYEHQASEDGPNTNILEALTREFAPKTKPHASAEWAAMEREIMGLKSATHSANPSSRGGMVGGLVAVGAVVAGAAAFALLAQSNKKNEASR